MPSITIQEHDMRKTRPFSLSALLVLVLTVACNGTFELRVETPPREGPTVQTLETENAPLATQAASTMTPTPEAEHATPSTSPTTTPTLTPATTPTAEIQTTPTHRPTVTPTPTAEIQNTATSRPPATSTPTPTPTPTPCTIDWFFDNPPADLPCPAEPVRSPAAAQHFQHGMMIWVEALGCTFVVQDIPMYEGAKRKDLSRIFDPLTIIDDTSGEVQPPEGLHAPVSGFGLIWRGDVTDSLGFQERLGWALAPEFAYEAVYQCDTTVPTPGGRFGPGWREFCFLKAPDDKIIVMYPQGGWYWLDE